MPKYRVLIALRQLIWGVLSAVPVSRWGPSFLQMIVFFNKLLSFLYNFMLSFHVYFLKDNLKKKYLKPFYMKSKDSIHNFKNSRVCAKYLPCSRSHALHELPHSTLTHNPGKSVNCYYMNFFSDEENKISRCDINLTGICCELVHFSQPHWSQPPDT